MLRRLARDTDGQDLVEYALLVALVVVASVVALQGAQNVISTVWQAVSNNLSGGI